MNTGKAREGRQLERIKNEMKFKPVSIYLVKKNWFMRGFAGNYLAIELEDEYGLRSSGLYESLFSISNVEGPKK